MRMQYIEMKGVNIWSEWIINIVISVRNILEKVLVRRCEIPQEGASNAPELIIYWEVAIFASRDQIMVGTLLALHVDKCKQCEMIKNISIKKS